MTYLVVNPTWTVPPTIFRQDILPPCVAIPPISRRATSTRSIHAGRLSIRPRWIGQGRNPPYRLVQRPGADNALGRIKFMFPNEHSVYLHDTPSRDLFDRDSRAFSSGCTPRREPIRARRQLLGSARARERLDTLVAGGKTQTVFLDKPMTVMLLYWTAGGRRRRPSLVLSDVYQRDAAVIAALEEPFRAPTTL
jgi:murein L,D-transpeptidase YcbB/YkuD